MPRPASPRRTRCSCCCRSTSRSRSGGASSTRTAGCASGSPNRSPTRSRACPSCAARGGAGVWTVEATVEHAVWMLRQEREAIPPALIRATRDRVQAVGAPDRWTRPMRRSAVRVPHDGDGARRRCDRGRDRRHRGVRPRRRRMRPSRAAGAASVTEYTLGALVFDGKRRTPPPRPSATAARSCCRRLRRALVRRAGGPAHLSLQRRVGSGPWTTTSGDGVLTRTGSTVRTPAYATTAAKRRCPTASCSAAYRTRRSGADHVRVPRRRASSTRTSALHRPGEDGLPVAEPYCPSTAVHVAGLSDAAGDYSTGALLIQVTAAVRSYKAKDVRALALHECSHERQWLELRRHLGGQRAMTARGEPVFADWAMPAGGTLPVRVPGPVDHAHRARGGLRCAGAEPRGLPGLRRLLQRDAAAGGEATAAGAPVLTAPAAGRPAAGPLRS